MRTPRGIIAVAIAGVLLLQLTGCASNGAVESFPGVPAGEEAQDTETGLQAFWLQDGAQLAITIWGSSGCPAVGSDLTVVETSDRGNTIQVEVKPISDGPCTADFVPYTTVFSTPGLVTTTKPLNVQYGDTEYVLAIK